MKKTFTLVALMALSLGGWSQNKSETQQPALTPQQKAEKLKKLSQRLAIKYYKNIEKARDIARKSGQPLKYSTPTADFELVGLDEKNRLVYYTTHNLDAAETTSTDDVWASTPTGYGLTGGGLDIGEWDGGAVLTTHQEFGSRVTQVDGATGLSSHATHVAGTLIAAGVSPTAKGMAYDANLSAHDWNNDDAEMANYGATGLVSNHSYGTISGWRDNNGTWEWWGDTTLSATEDDNFGKYSTSARDWDSIAWLAPNYLIVKSAGNDRNDGPPAGTLNHEVMVFSGGSWVGIPSNTYRPQDGGVDGYDCMSIKGTAKNILTVGAVFDIPGGYSNPNDVIMTSFSNWGPTDDGRIKPDLVGNGVGLNSTSSSGNTNYYSSSGTSMSSPNVAGSLLLLQEMYNDSNNAFMLSSTLKGLALHTADEAGANDGPDYSNGWGLLNTKSAADVIADTISNRILEENLSNNTTYTYTVYSDGTQPLAATICWNDPPGLPKFGLDDTTSNLINDLDLRILDSGGNASQPWILDPSNPSAAATTGDNFRDNVEKVFIANPTAGFYTIQVTHKGTLHANQPQEFSLIATGLAVSGITAPVAEFSASDSTVCVGDVVTFTDLSQNSPTTWSWIINGANPQTSSLQNPVVQFDTAGIFTVELTASNPAGSDTETKLMFIEVVAYPQVDFTEVIASGLDTFCVNEPDFDITTASPFGGVFSGAPIVIDSTFSASAAGVGTHEVYYSVDSVGCISTDTVSVEVIAAPTVTHTSGSTVCDATPAFVILGGSPAGGTYSGPGVVNGQEFNPAMAGVGTHSLTYSFTNAQGCSNTATVQFEVTPSPAVDAGAYPILCSSSSPIALVGTPLGGQFSGTGVQSGMFYPATAGVGVHDVIYTIISGACTVSDTVQIAVDALPTVTISAINDVCLNAGLVTLTQGLPVGGTYFGNGVTAGSFDPVVTGIGTQQIGYAFTNGNGCSDTAYTTINVVNGVTVATTPLTGVCESEAPFALTMGSPAGGVYSGVGMVNDSIFDPSLSGSGTFDIVYSYNVNGCVDADTNTITVDAAPVVNFADLGVVCVSDPIINLASATPAGGVYAGPFVSNGQFDPQTAGIGIFTLTYTVVNGSCTVVDSATVEVNDGTAEILNIVDEICENEPPLILLPTPAGGVLSGPGLTANLFNPNDAGVGTHTITYSTTGTCSDTVDYSITVHPKPIINTVVGPLNVLINSTNTYSVPANNGSAYEWIVTGGDTNFTTNNAVNITWGMGTVGFIEVFETNQFGCVDSTTVRVDINATSVHDLAKEGNVNLYPNPASRKIAITASSKIEIVRVYAISGKLLQEVNNVNAIETDVDVSGLAQGVYWVEVLGKNHHSIVKLIKQ